MDKILLLAGHPYVLHDAYMGGELTTLLNKMGADVLHTDYVDRSDALKVTIAILFTSTEDFDKKLTCLLSKLIIYYVRIKSGGP